jgi:tyrosyl-tRNA synthetase
VVITVPLLEGLDGVQKMSKSLGNYVGIDEPPQEMFGKIMSVSDPLMLRFFELLTDITPAALARLKEDLAQGSKHPRQVKEDLAVELVERYHGRAAADHAAEEFARIFRDHALPEEIEEVTLKLQEPKQWIARVLADAGLTAGTSEARRLVSQGGVQVDGEKVTDVNLELAAGATYLLKVGKRRFKRVILEK